MEGMKEGVGIDGVGVEPDWVEENVDTPFEIDGPFLVVIKKRTAVRFLEFILLEQILHFNRRSIKKGGMTFDVML